MTSDSEAELLFAHPLRVTVKTRQVENNGRYWLAAYLVPLVLGGAGALVLSLARREAWRSVTDASGMFFLCTLLACSLAAVVFGLISILRKEMNSYYAFQPFICGFLVFVFSVAWAVQ